MSVKTLEELRDLEAKWAEVDLDALAYNIQQIRAKVGPEVKYGAVVKANCCGHGVSGCISTFMENGVSQFITAVLSEALEVRRLAPDVDVLILGNIPYGTEEISIGANFQHMVTSFEKAQLLSDAAEKLGTKARVHIKLDTGMTRLGFQMNEGGIEEVLKIAALPGLDMEGIFTHFARADEADKQWADLQYEKYCWFVDQLAAKGLEFRMKHVSNSAAIMEMPNTYNDMVRPGIIQYGIYPSAEVLPENLDIKPVMTWKTRILHVKELPEDRQVGYGGKYIAKKGDTVGTLAIGYADGYTRAQSGKATVLYKGQRVPVIGNICMDQCMIDLSQFPDAKVGDEVVLMGIDGDDFISADEIAGRYGTIGYEVACAVHRRVPRYYIKGGKIVDKRDYMEDTPL